MHGHLINNRLEASLHADLVIPRTILSLNCHLIADLLPENEYIILKHDGQGFFRILWRMKALCTVLTYKCTVKTDKFKNTDVPEIGEYIYIGRMYTTYRRLIIRIVL
jgi:hypothetical protein